MIRLRLLRRRAVPIRVFFLKTIETELITINTRWNDQTLTFRKRQKFLHKFVFVLYYKNRMRFVPLNFGEIETVILIGHKENLRGRE